VNRLFEPTSGKVFFTINGKQVEVTALRKQELRELRKNVVSMVFQSFALFPYRTVLSNITFGMEVQKKDKSLRYQNAREILSMVGLSERENSYPSQLSGGMQQRVGLARALATEAQILLMDEPFSALDPLIRVRMQDELLKLQNKLRKTILFVTHDLDEALKLGEHIAIMEEGKIVQMGRPEHIILNPRTEYVANFVQNADPSGVVTARTIVENIPECSLPLKNIQKKKAENHCIIDRERQIVLCMDEKMSPTRALRSNEELPVKTIHKGKFPSSTESREEYLPAITSEVVLRDIISIMMNANLPLVLVLSKKGAVKGVISEKPLFQTILKKIQTSKQGSANEKNHYN
ncbi:MAG: ATP-binding cassette domain-containing protein, partial [Spirochaetota bacterium]